MTTKIVFYTTATTSASTAMILSDYGTPSTVECIGGGSGASKGQNGVNFDHSGAGGAYSAQTNPSFTPGATVAAQVGAGGLGATATETLGIIGSDTWIATNNTATLITSSGVVCGAKGAGVGSFSGGTVGTPATGGAAASGIGTTRNSGGNGNAPGGGGGGAAGPRGNGGNGGATVNAAGNGGGGGGGSGGGGSGTGGSNGGQATQTNGLPGGNNAAGVGSGAGGTVGTPNGTAGTVGGGGGGGFSTGNGGNGGPGADWTATAGGTAGAGGGGGGIGNMSGTSGGNGGLYGGGGGAGWVGNTQGNGAQGIIVLTYTSTLGGRTDAFFFSLALVASTWIAHPIASMRAFVEHRRLMRWYLAYKAERGIA